MEKSFSFALEMVSVPANIFSILAGIILISCNTKSISENQRTVRYHDVYYEKVIFVNGNSSVRATRLLDSAKIYGYVSGYDPQGINEYKHGVLWPGDNSSHNICLIQNTTIDTITSYFENIDLDTINDFGPHFIHVNLVLQRNASYGRLWIWDLYYSEMLSKSGVSISERTGFEHKLLVVYPREGRKEGIYEVYNIWKRKQDGVYIIEGTHIDYCNRPHAKILKEYDGILKPKHREEIDVRLRELAHLDLKNQCTGQDPPAYLIFGDRRFSYMPNCVNEELENVSGKPLGFALYLFSINNEYED